MRDRDIDYVEGYNENEEGMFLPRRAHIRVTMNHTKRYHNCLFLLAKLPPCARDLADWLTEQMDEDNTVYNNITSRKKFQDFISKSRYVKETYKDITIKVAFKTLVKRSILLSKNRGVYQMNPLYFFKGTDNKRIESITLNLEFNNHENTRLMVNTKTKTL